MASSPSYSPTSTAPTISYPDLHNVNPQYYHYPPVHRPPPAHINHVKRLSEAQRTDTTRGQSSISSEVSGSSAGLKQCPSPQMYRHASNVEQGLISEKARASWCYSIPSHGTHSPSKQEMVEDNSAVVRYIQQQQHQTAEVYEAEEDDHAIWILFWLSFLDPIHSSIGAIYTVLVVLILIIAYPIRLCKSQSSLGDQFIQILAPLFRNHLDMLYAPSVDNAYTFRFKPLSLICINLFSPFLSIGIMLAAWVSAAFWLFAITMGNPDGTEKGDDGRNTVLLIRNRWERYLLSTIKS